ACPEPPGTRRLDSGPTPCLRSERAMHVARPRVLLGAKDRDLIADGEARLRRQLCTLLLLDLMFAPSSPVRERLAHDGIVDDSLTFLAMAEPTFGFAAVGGETDEPARFADALREVLCRPLPVAVESLERARRKTLGQYVRGFESARALAFGHAEQGLAGVRPFLVREILASITPEELAARQAELFAEDGVAVAAVVGEG